MADTKTKPAAKKPASSAAPAAQVEAHQGAKTGVVESDKRNKTRRVVVSFMSKHPKYGKYVRNRTILQVHDEKNQSHTGDVVEVKQCRPRSKTKNWELIRIVERRAELVAAVESVKQIQ
jgi:small subunit ribosomal protein S17